MGGQGRKTIIPLFSPKRYRKRYGLPKPLPLGEVALRSNDGEGKPGRKEPLRSDGQALCQSDTIAVSELFGSGLALSVSSQAPRQLPQRGSPWHVGQALLRTTSQSASQTAPLVGEPLAKPFTLRGLPKPPLGRGGGTASAVTERLSSSPRGGAIGRPGNFPLSRLRRD